MATTTEEVVRKAYHYAEGDVFRDMVNGNKYRGEHLGDVLTWMTQFAPDIHRELHKVTVLGDVVAIELSIQGTFTQPFQTPAGPVRPTGAQLGINPDFATAVAA